MSEIGTTGSPIALTSKTVERPGETRPVVRNTAPDIDRFNPDGGEDVSAVTAEEKPEDVDLSIKALAEGDPLEKAGKALEKFIPDVNALPNTKLRINKHDETGHFVYQSIDNDSGEVVRQFPPEDLLEFLAFYQELRGKVVDEEV